jgi:hypothetical protein
LRKAQKSQIERVQAIYLPNFVVYFTETTLASKVRVNIWPQYCQYSKEETFTWLIAQEKIK